MQSIHAILSRYKYKDCQWLGRNIGIFRWFFNDYSAFNINLRVLMPLLTILKIFCSSDDLPLSPNLQPQPPMAKAEARPSTPTKPLRYGYSRFGTRVLVSCATWLITRWNCFRAPICIQGYQIFGKSERKKILIQLWLNACLLSCCYILSLNKHLDNTCMHLCHFSQIP